MSMPVAVIMAVVVIVAVMMTVMVVFDLIKSLTPAE